MKVVAMTRVLYIEDDRANIALIRRYLSGQEWDLIEAPDGGSGIILAVGAIPDVILLDIYLPDMHGIEVADQIKAIPLLANIPVIALTTDDSIDLKNECLAHGFAAVLHKPVRPQNLLNTIQHISI